MNTAKYFLVNGDNIIGIVYESDKYGRTLVVLDKLNTNSSLAVRESNGNKVANTDLMEFLYSMIPNEEPK
jgi:hypothetical protein